MLRHLAGSSSNLTSSTFRPVFDSMSVRVRVSAVPFCFRSIWKLSNAACAFTRLFSKAESPCSVRRAGIRPRMGMPRLITLHLPPSWYCPYQVSRGVPPSYIQESGVCRVFVFLAQSCCLVHVKPSEKASDCISDLADVNFERWLTVSSDVEIALDFFPVGCDFQFVCAVEATE